MIKAEWTKADALDLQPTTDCISRQAAIAEFSCCELTPDGGIDANYAIDFLEQLPSAQPEQRWIPSGEKPPEEGSYLVWMPFAPPKHRMTVAKYCGGYWDIKTPISAWMPLPEPYKVERNE